MGKLSERIEDYIGEGMIPFHMPGHKRRTEGLPEQLRALYANDLTEVPGTDDLHAPVPGEMLYEAQERAAAVYGARKSFFLLGGSTEGVLAAISAALGYGGTLLIQRRSHKSAYHAAELRGLHLKYLYGEKVCGGYDRVVRMQELRSCIEQDPEIGAVFLTSPSYVGFSCDLGEIAEYLHRKGIALIVDAAHGAHFGMAEYLPESAVQAGADISVMSLHKMLPAPTQTAILHLPENGGLIDEKRVRHFLDIYQSTSPSYPLMAGIDHCIGLLEKWHEEDDAVWKDWYRRRERLSRAVRGLKRIRIIDHFAKCKEPMPEPGKLLLCPTDQRSGYRMEEELRRRYRIQAEMALPEYVLLICTVQDTEEMYETLAAAIRELDGDEGFWKDAKSGEAEHPGGNDAGRESTVPETVMTIAAASELPTEEVSIADSPGRISADYVCVYPPGQPLLVPGEKVTKELVDRLSGLKNGGGNLQGLTTEGRFHVLK